VYKPAVVKRTGLGFECTVCGAKLDCGPDAKPMAIIVQSGGNPTTRQILCNGVEIHRCKGSDLRPQQNGNGAAGPRET